MELANLEPLFKRISQMARQGGFRAEFKRQMELYLNTYKQQAANNGFIFVTFYKSNPKSSCSFW